MYRWSFIALMLHYSLGRVQGYLSKYSVAKECGPATVRSLFVESYEIIGLLYITNAVKLVPQSGRNSPN